MNELWWGFGGLTLKRNSKELYIIGKTKSDFQFYHCHLPDGFSWQELHKDLTVEQETCLWCSTYKTEKWQFKLLIQPAGQIPDSLIIPTTGQSRLAGLNYCRIIVILGFSSDLWQPVRLSSSLFHVTKENTHFAVLWKPRAENSPHLQPF